MWNDWTEAGLRENFNKAKCLRFFMIGRQGDLIDLSFKSHSIIFKVIPSPRSHSSSSWCIHAPFHHSWIIPLNPDSSHHSPLILIIVSVKSGLPPPSAEGVGWPDLTLTFKFHTWVFLFNPNSSHHSPDIIIIVSVKSGHPPPFAEGVGWINFTLPITISSETHSLRPNSVHPWIQFKANPLDSFWRPLRPIRGLNFEPQSRRFLALSSILVTAIPSSFCHSTIILSFLGIKSFDIS